MDSISLLSSISKDLMIPVNRLERVINGAPYRYKVYYIPKRSGNGRRKIAQPAKEVKVLQYWVIKNILSKFSVHSAAKAYVKGCGLLFNVLPHSSKEYLIKLDFKDFFYSIKARDFFSHASAGILSGFSEEDLNLLIKILFYDKGANDLCLSIGAPSSPLLSNIIMYNFDCALSDYCLDKGVVYTRYSDDIALSMNSSVFRSDVLGRVRQLIEELPYPKLIINEDKTIYSSKAGKRIVTGLVVTNDGGVSIGREKKRIIRVQIHRFSKGILDESEIDELKGMLAYVKSVEPDFINRMKSKYGPLLIF